MENFIYELKNLSAINTLFLILSLIGIFLAFIFFVRSKKEKMPYYRIKSFNIVGENITSLDNLEVKFKETEIDNLTSTQVSVFNLGELAIKRNDLAKKDKLRIETLETIQILDWKIKYMSNDVNNFSVSQTLNQLEIDFDYFGKNEGLIVQLFHNGKSSDDVVVKGTIIDSKPIRQAENRILNAHYAQKFIDFQNRMPNIIQVLLAFPVIIVIMMVLIENIIKGNQTVPSAFMLEK